MVRTSFFMKMAFNGQIATGYGESREPRARATANAIFKSLSEFRRSINAAPGSSILEIEVAERFIPVEAPFHSRPLNRLEIALVARRNALEIIPALAYRQPIVSGDMLVRWHMLADPAGLKRVLLDNQHNIRNRKSCGACCAPP